MRTFFLCLIMTLISFGLVVNEASAKRFGGGRSFGVQRSQSSLFKQSRPQNASSFAQKTGASKWGGILGGALVGGLLASLFMGHGLANGILTWLILGLVLFVVIGFFRKRMHPGMASGFQSPPPNPFKNATFNNFTSSFNTSSSSNSSNFSDYPKGFVPEQFLRESKINFIRLQNAYDQKNLQDLSDFTAPEVFAEIKMQLDERGDTPNKTEVINLEAQLLDVSIQSSTTIASVRFTGSIKENDEPVTPLDEIWHFRQFEPNGKWLVGGIQQEITGV